MILGPIINAHTFFAERHANAETVADQTINIILGFFGTSLGVVIGILMLFLLPIVVILLLIRLVRIFAAESEIYI